MPEMPMIGARCPNEWQAKIKELAKLTGRTDTQIIREAISQYLGINTPSAVKGLLDSHEERLCKLEAKLRHLAG